METTNTDIFEQIGSTKNNLWKLKFSGITQLQVGDGIDSFTICANDNNPYDPSETAEHFFIAGFNVDAITAITVEADVVPEPATVALLCFGVLMMGRYRKGRLS